MYETLKKVALSVISRKILFENEVFFRSISAFHLHGKEYACTVCERGVKKFIQIPDGDLICPFCGSRSRTRRLSNFLEKQNLLHGSVLHFSPSRSLFRKLKKDKNLTYVSTDYEDEFIADFKYDITNIPLENESFDLIICYHVLEHIEDDKKAMSELHRVLKPNGKCIIQTPFKEGDIFEDFSKRTPKERLEAFGQDDHVRIYSVEGLKNRLKEGGFKKIEIETFPEEHRYGFMNETMLIAQK